MASPSSARRKPLPVPFLLLLLALPACDRPMTVVEQGNRTGTLHFGNATEPRDLDPQIITGLTDSYLTSALFEGLVVIDPESLAPLPGVAERWEISPDGRVYTFHLRRDARWSNGDPVTADDFVYAYRRILSPALGAEYAYMLYPLRHAADFNSGKLTDFSRVGVQALSPDTLQIVLAEPTPYLLSLLAHQSWMPVHRPTIERHGPIDKPGTRWTRPGNLVGNGPFQLTAWRVTHSITVRKNPHYWDADNVGLNEIRFYPIESDSTEERAFRSGQLHVTYGVPQAKIATYRRDRPADIHFVPWLETAFLRLNVTRLHLRDRRIRQALAAAIDRTALAERVLQGGQQPALAFTPPRLAGYTARAQAPSDPALARRLLEEAGHPNGAGLGAIELLFPTSDNGRRLCEALQQMWLRELGIQVSLRNEEFKVYLDTQRRLDYDVAFSLWIADYPDPNTFLDMPVSGGGNNDTGFADPEYDRLIHLASRTLRPVDRLELFQQAEARLLNELPFIPIYYGRRVYLARPEVRGFRPSPAGNILFKRIRLEPPAASR